MINYAHRGASEIAPENTMSAFCIGLFLGATGIETDVRRTLDGKLVLFHDEDLGRITGSSGAVEQRGYEDLLKLDFGAHKSPFFKGEKIVLLEDFLRYFRDKEIEFAVELKSDAIEKETAGLLYRYRVENKTIVTSFNVEHLRAIRSFDQKLRLGFLAAKIDDETLNLLEELRVNQICPEVVYLDAGAVRKAKERGFSVCAWGIKTHDHMMHAVECEVDGMTVDFPNALRSYLNSRQ